MSQNTQQFLQALGGDARWLLHELETATDRALFIEVPESAYHDSAFLDGRIAVRDPRTAAVPLSGLPAIPVRPGPAPWCIFHISHCGSTLYSQILPRLAPLLPLREPLPLRALAAMQRERGEPYAYFSDQTLDNLEASIWRLNARTFDERQRALIKATSDCGVLVDGYLETFDEARAILVHMPLEPFLATMLRSDLRRQETAHFCQSRLADLRRFGGFDDIRLYQLGDGEKAAMSWLSNLLGYLRIQERSDRTLWINFEDFVAAPVPHIQSLLGQLGERAQDARVEQTIAECTRSYAKDPTLAYGFEARARELDHGRRTAAAEIRAGIAWVEAQLRDLPQAEALAPLLP